MSSSPHHVAALTPSWQALLRCWAQDLVRRRASAALWRDRHGDTARRHFVSAIGTVGAAVAVTDGWIVVRDNMRAWLFERTNSSWRAHSALGMPGYNTFSQDRLQHFVGFGTNRVVVSGADTVATFEKP